MSMPMDQAFAIIGFSFKLPEDTVDESNLWQVLADRRNVMTNWPADRVSVDGFHDGGSKDPNTLHGTGGHFTREDPGVFDAPFFGVTAREAAAMDPKQRWALESAYHAFENAGLPMDTLRGSQTAVFAASMTDDYSFMQLKDPDTVPRSAATGIQPSMLPTRISWFYDLRGPSVHVDTACSGSMVALDMACQALRNGDAKMALVVGCNVLLGPEMSICLSNMSFLSPENRCFSFDTRGNGYARGEGVVSLVVRPLNDALANGDIIRAVIRMTGSNQDGRTPGITQPSAEMQEALIRHVYAKAELDLADTRYFEAHGTGTPTGDPIELTAISNVFRAHRSVDQPLYVGSIKANFGHLEGASGLAGVVKGILVLEKGIIPPNALIETMISSSNSDFSSVEVPNRCIAWPTSGLRRVSVNSFGFGGTNSHVILDDALHYLQNRGLAGIHHCVKLPSPERNANGNMINGTSYRSRDHGGVEEGLDSTPRLLVWSAGDTNSAGRMLQAYEEYFASHIAGNESKLSQLAYTLAARRSVMAWRSFAVSGINDKNARLSASLNARKPIRSSMNQLGTAFIFTGQGAQYSAMGLDLMVYPVFKASLEKSDAVLRTLGCRWSLFDKLQKDERIDLPELSQPLCTILQIALVELLLSLSVTPVAVVGHSSGEIAAAYTAGALSHESACKVAYFRGKLAGKLRASNSSGTMLSANLSAVDVATHLQSSGLLQKDTIHVACVNSPVNVTLSGPSEDMEILRAYLDEQDIFSRTINTGIAYHSPAMCAIAAEYGTSLDPLEPGGQIASANTVPIFSSVTGRILAKKLMLDPKYWVDNLVSTVQFSEALESLIASSDRDLLHGIVTDIVEIGPHAALRRPVIDTLSHAASSQKQPALIRYHSILERKKSSLITTLELLGSLYCFGYPVSVLAANRQTTDAKPPFLVNCPSYPFDHSRRYWSESRISKEFRLRPHSPGYLLGKRSHDHNTLRPRWRNWLSSERMPWLADHAVSGDTVCPGSGMLIMAIEAVKQAALARESNRTVIGFRIKEARFLSPIKVGESLEDAVETEVHLRATQKDFEKESSRSEVVIFTHHDDRWNECFRADIQVEFETPSNAAERQLAIGSATERDINHTRIQQTVKSAIASCTRLIDKSRFYAFCEDRGVRFGPSFQVLSDIHWDGDNISVASLNLPARSGVAKFQTGDSPVHPTALDAAVHLIFAQFTKGVDPAVRSATLIPQHLSNAWISAKAWDQPVGKSSVSNVRLCTLMRRQSDRAMSIDGTFYVLAEDDSVLCALEDMTLTEVSRPNNDVDNVSGQGLLYSIAWKPLLSSLGPEQLQELFVARAPDSSADVARGYLTKMELAMRTAGNLALQEISDGVLEHAPSHLRKFAGAIRRLFELHQQQGDRVLGANELEQLLQQCDVEVPELQLFSKVARALPSVLRNEVDPLELLFDPVTEPAKQFYARIFAENTQDGNLERFLDLKSHEIPDLKILEVGAGTGGFSQLILDAFQSLEHASGTSHFAQYTYTDISPSYFEGARSTFHSVLSRMKFLTLDVEQDPSCMGDACEGLLGSFDILVAGNVLHATSSLEKTLKNMRKLLKPGGHLILIEITAADSSCINITFGSLEGWWLSEEDWRQNGPLVNEERWDKLLRKTGFSGLDLTLKDHDSDDCHLSSIMISTAVDNMVVEPRSNPCEMSAQGPNSIAELPFQPNIMVLIDAGCDSQARFAAHIKNRYPETKVQQLRHTDSAPCDIDISPTDLVVSFLDLGGNLLTEVSQLEFESLQNYIQATQMLLWVSSAPATMTTNGNQIRVVTNPHYAMCMGFLRSIRTEEAGKHIVTLAIESCSPDRGPDFVLSLMHSCFLANGPESTFKKELEFLVRDDKLIIGRMVQEINLDSKRIDHTVPRLRAEHWQSGPPLTLDIGAPGMLDSLRFIRDDENDAALGDEEVEIEAAAWGLSFRDILIGLGRLGTERMGLDCAGVVTRVGAAVSNSDQIRVQPGDRVVMLKCGCIQSYPRAPAVTVLKIPDTLTFEDAASIIVPGITAYHSLISIARLRVGERILVHAGAGGTGQLFVSVAQMLGAEVFATVGSTEKKNLLMEGFGLPEDHILYSRDDSFAHAVDRLTAGRGVDVVVNSLSGNLLEASWACLGPNGRFIEIGKTDIRANSALPMSGFAQNKSFSGVDLHHILSSDKYLIRQLMDNVLKLASRGNIRPPNPIHIYPLSQVEQGFRYIQSGKNTGRVVLTVSREDVVPTSLVAGGTWRFDINSSYLVVGGFGGLGRAIIRWMANRGARNIIVISRSAISSQAATALVANLLQRGVRIAALPCNASSLTDLSTALAQCADMPPIKGCINSAMALQDAVFENMTYEQWKITIQSKIATSWNLHCLLPSDMDFFILLSSLGGIYGTAGQSNYAAGCTFQDALARYRSSLGLASSISLDLGWMRTIGIVAENEQYQRHRHNTGDMAPVEESDLLAVLDEFCDPMRGPLEAHESQLLVGAVTPAHFRARGEQPLPFMGRPLFAGLDYATSRNDQQDARDSKQANIAELFQKAENDPQRVAIVVEALKARLARALGVDVDDIDLRKALSDYGVDSLMAVELRNWVRKDFDATVSVFEIMGGKSMVEVAELLVFRAQDKV